jgi:Uma2 family endonuclease
MNTASDLRLTNADLEAMPDDGNRYEVIDGELYVSSAPGFTHQSIFVNIVIAFADYLREHRLAGSCREWGSSSTITTA